MTRSFFFLALSGIALAFSQLQADQILLDDVMTRQEQKETGVANLTMKQKVALEAWINRTFVLKTAPSPEDQTQLSLSINIDNGQKLQLSDNSIWEIAPSDITTSAVWITPFPVKIVPSNDPTYPYLIININSGVSVKARKVPAMTQPKR